MVDIYSLYVGPPLFSIDFCLKSYEEGQKEGGVIEKDKLSYGRIKKKEPLSGYGSLYSCINGKVKSAWGMINTSRSGLPMCVPANSNASCMV